MPAELVERAARLVRFARGVLAAGLAVTAGLLAVTGVNRPVHLGWGPLRLRATGAPRPLFIFLACLVLLGTLPGGWLRSLASALRDRSTAPLSLPPWARALRGLLLAGSAGFAALPLVLSPTRPWPQDNLASPGYVLLAAVAAFYAFLAARGLFGPPGCGGRTLSGADLALCVLLPLYVLSNSNGVILSSGDNRATRLIAPVLVRTGSLDLAGVSEFADEPDHYSAVAVRGRLLPAFPLGTGLLEIPHAVAALPFSRVPLGPDLVGRWEKHFSSLLLCAATALLFLGLRRSFGEGAALTTSLVFALSTTAFSCVGQAMYSTTGEVFCFCLALYLLAGEGAQARPAPWAAAGGLALATAFLCRPSAAIAAAVLTLWLFLSGRRRDSLWCGAAFGAGAVLACGVLFVLYGNPLGGYGLLNARQSAWGGSILEGTAGNLFSPSRGLFPHFPYLLLVPLAWRQLRDDRRLRSLWLASVVAVAGTVLLAGSYFKWWGGHSLGPRLLTEAAPFLALASLPLWISFARLAAPARAAAVLLALFAAGTQVLGVSSSRPDMWNSSVVVDWNPSVRWSIRDSQILATWWTGWFPSWKRTPRTSIEGDMSRWIRVDLSPAANARYDSDPFSPSPRAGAPAHYPALDSDALNGPRAPFHFLPRGRPNAATTCQGGRSFELPLPSVPASRLHLLLTAGATKRRPGNPVVARAVVVYADGTEERHDLALDRDVWEYAPDRRFAPVDPARVYLGRPDEPDVLVELVLIPARTAVPLRLLRVENVDPGSGEGVTLFAATIEK